MALVLSDRDDISSVLMGDPRTIAAVRASAVPTLPSHDADTGTLSPLMDVALRGLPDELSSMLQGGRDLNAVATSVGITALMCAAHDPRKTALLIAAGANVNAAARTGHTALLIAADYDGAAESVKLLLEHGADPNAHTSQPARMNTPLTRAALRGDRAVVALLLEHAATLNDHPTGSSALLAGSATPTPRLSRSSWIGVRTESQRPPVLVLRRGGPRLDAAHVGGGLGSARAGDAAAGARCERQCPGFAGDDTPDVCGRRYRSWHNGRGRSIDRGRRRHRGALKRRGTPRSILPTGMGRLESLRYCAKGWMLRRGNETWRGPASDRRTRIYLRSGSRTEQAPPRYICLALHDPPTGNSEEV